MESTKYGMVQQKPDLTSFKDLYYILGVGPDAAMPEIERAYWGLVRSRGSPGIAMDDVNEAYDVLGSPRRRRAYDELRNSVLGAGAPPEAPPVEEQTRGPPLAVMEKQRPRPRRRPAPAPKRRRWRGLPGLHRWSAALLLVVVLSVVTLVVIAVFL